MQHLMQASRTWEKDDEDVEDGVDEFAQGDDEEELELDMFRHVIIQWVLRFFYSHFYGNSLSFIKFPKLHFYGNPFPGNIHWYFQWFNNK